MKLKPIKVSVLNQFIKKYIMSNSILNNLRIEGEISNIRISKTGYTYYSLCDEKSCINCVAFYQDTISKNGDKVIAEGELSVYEAKGTYQLNVRKVERIGIGKILQDLEVLHEKMKAKGMFDKDKKLPLFPSNIGIITSKSGAAIKDILKTFESVKGNFEVVIYNVLVQGNKAKENIINGIKYFNNNGSDVILISRGGGSFEDLNVFNDLDIAEEVYKSIVPIVTGIGHETDRTLTDYVADVYCHTPTAAAEKIIIGYKDIQDTLKALLFNLKQSTSNYLSLKESELKTSRYILKSYLPIENIFKQKSNLENYKALIINNTQKKLCDLMYQLQIMYEKLQSNNYNNQLYKGFAIVSDLEGNIIKNINQIKKQDLLTIRFKDFIVKAETLNIDEVDYEKKL
ncbi:exodeoxyribonuclease VII large subunit [Sedimentibacter sp. MB31-C6]|uniref:exodeoxyribonuclease VII large subunit n=1 Tax=Sedimentibacter sp. MB31-C6 TaxID=3109366 RepID=UPI002DDD548A|nr:exodeoxyribonuclease VII large subunit [Sedimentibacter sp. MB36-C1]WSI04190.1 exodeoxyribonuclease VII large subunit [Sedimentibacter sp. MB36-C1]WSI05641.1 exodeoxyribonuclease VII large subunit [Sedimentibacter sp. MB36-C1]